MSHFTTIHTQIKDIASLKAACAELGLPLLQDTQARGFGSNCRHGQFVIRLKGPYDIALNRNGSGVYDLSTDWWNGHVANEVGENYGRLLQLYGVHKAMIEARQRGYRVARQTLETGEIKLTLQGA